MNKEPDAFKTISEVAEELRIPQHVLRFWETRFSQIKPMKRGGGRRYYRSSDVAFLNAIRVLLYDEGYTIKGVQKLLKDHGVSGFLRMYQQNFSMNDPVIDADDLQVDIDDHNISIVQEEAHLWPDTEESSTSGHTLFSFLKKDPTESKEKSDTFKHLQKEQQKVLQNVLSDLLECKRLLDQSREIS